MTHAPQLKHVRKGEAGALGRRINADGRTGVGGKAGSLGGFDGFIGFIENKRGRYNDLSPFQNYLDTKTLVGYIGAVSAIVLTGLIRLN
jgi:hypothetical protein